MRPFAFAVFAMMLAAQLVSQNLNGSAEGTVTQVDSGEPISNVRIAFGKFVGVTDADGHFVINGIPPGTYDVAVSRDGYVVPGRIDLNVVITPIPEIGSAIVSPNQQIKDFHVEMEPTGAISGRMLNPNGSPAPNIQPQLFWVTYKDGKRRITPLRGSNKWSPSDDRGEYRLFGIPSGEYYVLASPVLKAVQPAIGEPVATFYPATESLEKALPIRVSAGKDIRGIDISLLERQTTSISVKAVAPSSAEAVGFVEVSLVPADSREIAGGLVACIVVKCGFGSGQFTIRNIPQGRYSLFVTQTAQDTDYFGETEVQVGSQPVVNLTLPLRPGVDLAGHVTIVGDASILKLPSIPIGFRSTANLNYDSATRANRVQQNALAQGLSQGDSNGATLLADRIAAELATLDSQGARRETVVNEHVPGPDSSGRFTIRGLPPGHYNITPSSLPPGAFILDVRQKDKSIMNTGLTIGAETPEPLDIIVSASTGATVKGTVRNANQTGVGFTRAILVPAVDRQNLSLYLTVTADYAGQFTFSGVAPGDYKVFSWTNVPPGAWMNSEFMQKYESFGTIVTVKEGETSADISVNIVPLD